MGLFNHIAKPILYHGGLFTLDVTRDPSIGPENIDFDLPVPPTTTTRLGRATEIRLCYDTTVFYWSADDLVRVCIHGLMGGLDTNTERLRLMGGTRTPQLVYGSLRVGPRLSSGLAPVILPSYLIVAPSGKNVPRGVGEGQAQDVWTCQSAWHRQDEYGDT